MIRLPTWFVRRFPDLVPRGPRADEALLWSLARRVRPASRAHALEPVALEAYCSAMQLDMARRSNRDLLGAIRLFNHGQIDALDRHRPIRGCRVLDVGAAPQGYALERALERGAALYVGIGLDIPDPVVVSSERDASGWLFPMDAGDIAFPDRFFDAVVSLSVFEHLLQPDRVVAEIARVLRPGGRALLFFEPVWSCSYGHHLHHFGPCSELVPPWGHLRWTPDEMRERLSAVWPADAPLSLEAAVHWTFQGDSINRLAIADYRRLLADAPLDVVWMAPLPDTPKDDADVRDASARTGISPEDLMVRGLSVLLESRR